MGRMTKFAGVIALVGALGMTARAASANVLYDTTGGVENGGDPISVVGPDLADFVKTQGASTLQSFTLNIEADPMSSASFQLYVYDVATATYTPLGNVTDSSLTTSFQLYTVSGLSTALTANTLYLFGIQDNGGSTAVLGNTVDPTVLARPPVVAGGFYYNTQGGVQPNAGGPYEISVLVTPEPAAWAMMLLGLGSVGAAMRLSRRTRIATA